MKDIVRLMRPKHWIKNMLIVIPAFFSRNHWETQIIINLVIGFLCFSFLSSVVYIFNDMKDIEKDRQHEVKCFRPLACGAVSIIQAKITILLLIVSIIALSWLLCSRISCIPVLWCAIYLGINAAYSIWLKHIPIVDVAILAAGFMIRIFYGASVSGIEASSWLCLTVMSFALYMGIGKRRNELKQTGSSSTRKVLQYYDLALLEKYMMIVTTLGIVFYSFWAGMIVDNRWVIWTVPVVLIMIMKYEMILKEDAYGDPVEVLLSDKVLCGMAVFYVSIMIILLYI